MSSHKHSYIYDCSAVFEIMSTIGVAESARFPLPQGYRLVSVLYQQASGCRVDTMAPTTRAQRVANGLTDPDAKAYVQFDCTSTDVTSTPTLYVLLLIEEGEEPEGYLSGASLVI